MTPEEKDAFIEVARVGVTQGFYDIREWLCVYAGYANPQFFPNRYWELSKEGHQAFLAFWSETSPGETTLEMLTDLCEAHLKACCFPGCYKEGIHKVEGRENSNLKLCDLHKGCVRDPSVSKL